MQTFLIEYYVPTNLISAVSTKGQPVYPAVVGYGDTEHVDAESRVEAFISFYNQYKTDTKDVTVEAMNDENPLGFTDDELRQIEEAGINLDVSERVNQIYIKSIKEF